MILQNAFKTYKQKTQSENDGPNSEEFEVPPEFTDYVDPFGDDSDDDDLGLGSIMGGGSSGDGGDTKGQGGPKFAQKGQKAIEYTGEDMDQDGNCVRDDGGPDIPEFGLVIVSLNTGLILFETQLPNFDSVDILDMILDPSYLSILTRYSAAFALYPGSNGNQWNDPSNGLDGNNGSNNPLALSHSLNNHKPLSQQPQLTPQPLLLPHQQFGVPVGVDPESAMKALLIPTTLAWHPTQTFIAMGRIDGMVSIYTINLSSTRSPAAQLDSKVTAEDVDDGGVGEMMKLMMMVQNQQNQQNGMEVGVEEDDASKELNRYKVGEFQAIEKGSVLAMQWISYDFGAHSTIPQCSSSILDFDGVDDRDDCKVGDDDRKDGAEHHHHHDHCALHHPHQLDCQSHLSPRDAFFNSIALANSAQNQSSPSSSSSPSFLSSPPPPLFELILTQLATQSTQIASLPLFQLTTRQKVNSLPFHFKPKHELVPYLPEGYLPPEGDDDGDDPFGMMAMMGTSATTNDVSMADGNNNGNDDDLGTASEDGTVSGNDVDDFATFDQYLSYYSNFGRRGGSNGGQTKSKNHGQNNSQSKQSKPLLLTPDQQNDLLYQFTRSMPLTNVGVGLTQGAPNLLLVLCLDSGTSSEPYTWTKPNDVVVDDHDDDTVVGAMMMLLLRMTMMIMMVGCDPPKMGKLRIFLDKLLQGVQPIP